MSFHEYEIQMNVTSPYAGGLAIIAWTLKGTLLLSGHVQAGKRELMMDLSCFLCILISDVPDGRKPLFFTMSVIHDEHHLELLAEMHSTPKSTSVICFISQHTFGKNFWVTSQWIEFKACLQNKFFKVCMGC